MFKLFLMLLLSFDVVVVVVVDIVDFVVYVFSERGGVLFQIIFSFFRFFTSIPSKQPLPCVW